MIYFTLFKVFFIIGLFSFGGGYAIISLIQAEMEYYGWINSTEFADIIAISQMTPGPISVNTATYVGAGAAGILGATTATLSLVLPSFIIMVTVAHYFAQFKDSKAVEWILKGIRPVTIGLIFSVVVFLAETSILNPDSQSGFSLNAIISSFDFKSTLVFLLVFLSSLKFKPHPILVVVLSALIGLVIL